MNPWLIHVKKVRDMKQNKGKPLKEILVIAKKTYRKKVIGGNNNNG